VQKENRNHQTWIDFADPHWMDEFVAKNWYQLAQVAWEGFEAVGRGWVIVDEEDYRTSVEMSEDPMVIDLPYSYGAPQSLVSIEQEEATDEAYTFLVESVSEYDPEYEILVFFRGVSADTYHLLRTGGRPSPRDAFMGARTLH
jgi:hypothetical protein